MIDIANASLGAQSKIFDALESLQTTMLDGLQTWAATLDKLVPSQAAELVGKNPVVKVFPAPTAVADQSFDFAGRVLANQRKFAETVLAGSTTGSSDLI